MIQQLKEEFISLSTDSTFKYLMKEEKGKEWIGKIIKSICNIDIKDFILIDNELNQGDKKTKDYKLDLLLTNGKDHIIIEMQKTNADEKNYMYLERIGANNIDKGQEYENSKNILIQFKAYDDYYGKRYKNKYIFHFKIQEVDLSITKGNIESYEIMVNNLKNMDSKNLSNIEKKICMINCSSYDEMNKYVTDSLDEYIINRLKELSMDPYFRYSYNAETGKFWEMVGARKQGIEEGIEQGIEQGKINTIKILKSMELSIEEISNKMQIPIEEVEKIYNSIE